MHLHGKSKQWPWGGSPKFSQESLLLQKLAFHKLPSPNKRRKSPHNNNTPATKTFFLSPTVLNISKCDPIWSHFFLTFSWKNFIVGFLWVLPSYRKESWGSCVCVFSHVQLFAIPWTGIPPGASVYGILQARILEWFAVSYFRGSSWPRDRTCVSCLSSIGILYHCATWEAPSWGSQRQCYTSKVKATRWSHMRLPLSNHIWPWNWQFH